MTRTTRLDFRPLPACPAGTQDLKLAIPSSTRPLPCPACLAGSQVSQRCTCFIVQNFPFRLDKPTGAASCSCTLANYKSSARARRAGTGRDQMLPEKLFDRLLFVAHLRHSRLHQRRRLVGKFFRHSISILRSAGNTVEQDVANPKGFDGTNSISQ